MGHTGPWKNFVGLAPTFHALSGLISANPDRFGKPISLDHAYGDVITGLYAAFAVLASLEHKTRTGKGQHIDLSAYEALCTLLGPDLMNADLAKKQGGFDYPCGDCGESAYCGCYPCAGDDRWSVIVLEGPEQWQALCRISGKPELMAAKFNSPAGRRQNRSELDSLIAGWTIGYSAETVTQRLQKEGIAAGVVQNARDLAGDSQLAARRFFVSMKHSILGTTYSDRSALWPWREKPVDWKAAPQLGQDSHYIFVDLLGRSESDFRSLIKRGVIQ
jgi:benzylsuccinate CoA-transferase BbsF subunit